MTGSYPFEDPKAPNNFNVTMHNIQMGRRARAPPKALSDWLPAPPATRVKNIGVAQLSTNLAKIPSHNTPPLPSSDT